MPDDFIERVCQMRFDELRRAGLSEEESLEKMGREVEGQREENARRANDPPPRKWEDVPKEHQDAILAQIAKAFGPASVDTHPKGRDA